jgi:hypothetical protein
MYRYSESPSSVSLSVSKDMFFSFGLHVLYIVRYTLVNSRANREKVVYIYLGVLCIHFEGNEHT